MKNILNKKFPAVFGFLLITVGIVLTTLLVKTGGLFQINAGPGQEPKNVAITNISDSSFTLVYTTDDNVIGTINYGSDRNNLDSVALDDRDQLSQSVNKYTVHSATVRELSPDTTYYFNITSGDKKYLNNNSLYGIKTGSQIESEPSTHPPLSGKVILPDGSVPIEALVTISVNGAETLSTISKTDGSYAIPLNSLRNESLDQYFQLNQNSILNIEIISGGLSSSVSVSESQTNPVPIITLSNTYDFSSDNSSSSANTNNNGQSFPSIGSASKSTQPQILTPKSNEEFNDQQPNFKGTAIANETVTIEIHSNENIQTQIKANSDGKWSFRPSNPLSPGDHTITIKTKNSQGIIQSITQHFVVFASGDQVNQTATPSGTLTPTQAPSPTPTITKAPINEPTATPIPSTQISPVPTLPPTGNSSAIIAGVAGAMAIAGGIIIFLLAGKRIPL